MKVGLTKLTQIILGPNTLVQSVVEEALFGTKTGFYQETADKLQKNANYLVEHLSKIQGLKVIKPGGAMYMMVGEIEIFVNLTQKKHKPGWNQYT